MGAIVPGQSCGRASHFPHIFCVRGAHERASMAVSDRPRRGIWGARVLAVAGRASAFARPFAVVLVALVVIALTAPVASAVRPPRSPIDQASIGNPSSDSTVPQIPPGEKTAAVRAWIEHAIGLRLLALHDARDAISARSALTTNDRSFLGAQIASDRTGLVALAKSVRSENAPSQLQSAIDAMITDYRVFSVVVPQVETTIHIDGYEAITARLARTETEISAAVTTASALGDQGATPRAYQALVTDVQSAINALLTVHSSVVGLTPSSYPQATQVLASAQSTIVSVRIDIQTADSDIAKIVQLLRKRLGGSTKRS
jgi:hypothetical protein